MTIIYEGTTRPITMILHHHAVLRRGLEQHVGTLCQAADDGEPHEKPRADLLAYLETEILPHAKAEEDTLYRAAIEQARGSDLVHTLIGEHVDLSGLVERLRLAPSGPDAARIAEWIATLFAGHAAKENDVLLPALTDAGVDVAALLTDMHHALT